MPADRGAGRLCPVRYRYSVEIFDRSPQLRAHTVYVIGGLYGNREALDTVLAMAEQEHRNVGNVTLIFNGDFHWLDVRAEDFVQIDEAVLRHTAIQGNVEAELAAEGSEAGCGCAYPDYVDEGVVTRSNAIMARLRRTAMAFPERRRRLGELPMTLCIEVGSERIAILHGDPESLAGWNFAVEAMPPGGAAHVQRIRDYFRKAGVRVFACTHTGLHCAQRFFVDRRARLVINNGAAGMPNFAATRFGVITRISADERSPRDQPLRVPARRTAGRRLAGALRLRDVAATLSTRLAAGLARSPVVSYQAHRRPRLLPRPSGAGRSGGVRPSRPGMSRVGRAGRRAGFNLPAVP